MAVKAQYHTDLIYACGLRHRNYLSETGNIKSKRYILIILNAKGEKDRTIHTLDKVIEMLREYYKTLRPKIWLFQG